MSCSDSKVNPLWGMWTLQSEQSGAKTEIMFTDDYTGFVIVDEDVKFVDGMMYPSERPGLGIELDEEAAARFPKADHWLRHYAGTLTDVRPPDSEVYYHS